MGGKAVFFMVRRFWLAIGLHGPLAYFTFALVAVLTSLALVAFVGMPIVSLSVVSFSQKQPLWLPFVWAAALVGGGGLWWWFWKWVHDERHQRPRSSRWVLPRR